MNGPESYKNLKITSLARILPQLNSSTDRSIFENNVRGKEIYCFTFYF